LEKEIQISNFRQLILLVVLVSILRLMQRLSLKREL